MHIKIINPIKAIITNVNNEQIQYLKEQFTYTLESIRYLLKRHSKNYWFKQKNPIGWEKRKEELRLQLKASVIQFDGTDYWVRPGSICYIQDTNYEIENVIEYPKFKPIPWESEPTFNPYYYQEESIKELLEVKHGNIQLPTGSGKTFIFLILAKQMGLNSVIVTPSQSIFNEILKEFEKRLGRKYVGGYGDGKKDLKKKITIAIAKSLTTLKPGTEAYQFFREKQMFAADESHILGSETLEKVCHGVLQNVPYRFFVSATQTRNDGTEVLLQSIIGKNVYEKSILECIEEGFLCPLNFIILKVISPLNKYISDPLEAKREHFLYNPNIAELIAKTANSLWTAQQESTLILVEELCQISMLKDLLKVPFSYVHSGSKKEAEKWGLQAVDLQEEIDKFNEGKVRVLIGTKCISTGTNLFPTHNSINWQGGSSEIATKQGIMGRSTRKLEISKYKDLHKPKPFCRIFDFDVVDQPILKRQLQERIKYYEESGGEIKII